MPDSLEHECKRFGEMTVSQLTTRLEKITHETKLRNFIRVARECANRHDPYSPSLRNKYQVLAQLAQERLDKLFPSRYSDVSFGTLLMEELEKKANELQQKNYHVCSGDTRVESTKQQNPKGPEAYTKRKLRLEE